MLPTPRQRNVSSILFLFGKWFNEIVVTNKIKCRGVGGVEILEEITWNTAVRDILRDRFLF